VRENGLATLGFGARVDSYVSSGLEFESGYFAMAIPTSFQWYFHKQQALVRLRVTALLGTYVDVIPSLGFTMCFYPAISLLS
jgi:hypothetical protein